MSTPFTGDVPLGEGSKVPAPEDLRQNKYRDNQIPKRRKLWERKLFPSRKWQHLKILSCGSPRNAQQPTFNLEWLGDYGLE